MTTTPLAIAWNWKDGATRREGAADKGKLSSHLHIQILGLRTYLRSDALSPAATMREGVCPIKMERPWNIRKNKSLLRRMHRRWENGAWNWVENAPQKKWTQHKKSQVQGFGWIEWIRHRFHWGGVTVKRNLFSVFIQWTDGTGAGRGGGRLHLIKGAATAVRVLLSFHGRSDQRPVPSRRTVSENELNLNLRGFHPAHPIRTITEASSQFFGKLF